jgi:hypothetical protein
MENPATWGTAEHIVNNTYADWCDAREQDICGLSLARQITDALRAEGMLVGEVKDEYTPRHATPEPPPFT